MSIRRIAFRNNSSRSSNKSRSVLTNLRGSSVAFTGGSAPAFATASGGSVTTSGNYKIHTFSSSGTLDVTAGGTFEVLIAAGGGGGGCYFGGGGGAGGLLYGNLTLTSGSYPIQVGGGGSGGAYSPTPSQKGGIGTPSFLTPTYVADGGGGGGGHSGTGSMGNALSGGSGGGGGGGGPYAFNGFAAGATQGPKSGPYGTLTGYGNPGGSAAPPNSVGQGGGAGAAGISKAQPSNPGSAGKDYSISGSTVTYCGGGGVGIQGTGSGGGGYGYPHDALSTGGSGTPGVVIVRYQYQ